MNTITIKTDLGEIELLEYVPDYYVYIHEVANELLSTLRRGIKTWVSSEIYSKMNVSLWVYNSITVNAFAQHCDSSNYIAISIGLLQAFFDASKDFIFHPHSHKVIKLSDDQKTNFEKYLFLLMVNFIVAHEFGHIAHGHLLYDNNKKFISEYMSTIGHRTPEENLHIQMKEFDADNFAADINFLLCIQNTLNSENSNSLYVNIDTLYISTYLTFRVLAEKSNRDFSAYFDHEIDFYDHPHPGIRMFYSNIFYADWIVSNHLDINLIQSGVHVIINYDKHVLDKTAYKDCFYSIGQTKRGADHVKTLANGWRKLVSKYNRHAYIHIKRKEFIDNILYSLDENGNFLL